MPRTQGHAASLSRQTPSTGHSGEDAMRMVREVQEVCRELEQDGKYLVSLEFHVRILEVCRQEFGKTSKIAEEMYLNIAGLNLKLSRHHYDSGNTQEATNYLIALENLTARQLKHTASNLTRLIYRARMFDLLSLVKRRTGKLVCSLRYAEKAAMIFVQLDSAKDIPKSLLNLCALNSAMGLHDEALKYAYTALNAVKCLMERGDGVSCAEFLPNYQQGRGREEEADRAPRAEAKRSDDADHLYMDPDIVEPHSDGEGDGAVAGGGVEEKDGHSEPPPVLRALGTLAALILQGLEKNDAPRGDVEASERVWVHLLGVAAGGGASSRETKDAAGAHDAGAAASPSGDTHTHDPAEAEKRRRWRTACTQRKAEWLVYLRRHALRIMAETAASSVETHEAALRIQCLARGFMVRRATRVSRVGEPRTQLPAEALCEDSDASPQAQGAGGHAVVATAPPPGDAPDEPDTISLLVLVYHALAVEQEHCEMYTEHLDSYHLAVSAANEHLGSAHPLTQRIKASLRNATAAQQQRARAGENSDAAQAPMQVGMQRRRRERRQATRTTLAASLFTRHPQMLSLGQEGAQPEWDGGAKRCPSRCASPGMEGASTLPDAQSDSGSYSRRGVASRGGVGSRGSTYDATQLALAGSPGKALRGPRHAATRSSSRGGARSTTPSRRVPAQNNRPRQVWDPQAKSTRLQDEEYFNFIKQRKMERDNIETELLGGYKITSDPPKAEKQLPRVTKSKKPPGLKYVGCVPVTSWVKSIHDDKTNTAVTSPADREATQQGIVEAHNEWLSTAILDDLSFGAGVSAADMAYLSSTFNLSLRTRLPGSRRAPSRKKGRAEKDDTHDAHRTRMLYQREEAAAWLAQLKQQPAVR